MSSKRVVLVNHLLEPPNQISGITRYLFALLGELVSSPDYRYVLATTWSADRLPDVLRASADVVTMPFHRQMPVNVLAQTFAIARLMRKKGASLEFNCNPVGCFRGDWRRVITVHDLYMEVLPSFYPWRHRLWWKLIFPLCLRSASAVVCVSNATKREVESRYPSSRDRLTVIHEAGIIGSQDAPPDSVAGGGFDAPYALYVGNVSPNKNPAVLLEALSILYQRGIAPIVYHVGSDSAGLLAQAEQRMLPVHPLRRAKSLSDAELVAAYKGATCLINTSLNEGFCLPVVEAQSQGTPVICADIPVLREVAGEGALFFAPHDAETLAGRIESVFSDALLRQRLSASSLKNADRFSWRSAAEQTEGVFDAVLKNSTLRSTSGLQTAARISGDRLSET